VGGDGLEEKLRVGGGGDGDGVDQIRDIGLVVPEILVAEGEGKPAALVIGDGSGGRAADEPVGAEGGDIVAAAALKQVQIEELQFVFVEDRGGVRVEWAVWRAVRSSVKVVSPYPEGVVHGDVEALADAADGDDFAAGAQGGHHGGVAVRGVPSMMVSKTSGGGR
jgi:hypothetical protein